MLNQALRRGFTLLELLVVIGVLTLLLALVAPALWAARRQGQRLACLSNERQIVLAMHAYTADNDERFPIAQYFDQRQSAFVAWDTFTSAASPQKVQPGLIWQYVDGGAVQQCPGYDGGSSTSGDIYTGYNYNTTYIGRGENEGPYRGMGPAPAAVSEVRFPGTTVLIGDGGWVAGANKFMRAPLDTGVPEAAVHAGGQAYRHLDGTNAGYVDGHGRSLQEGFRKQGAAPNNERFLDWPKNGFLASDDRPYSHR